MLRDQGSDPKLKKAALGLLNQALGRTTTHYNFLPQRPQHPVKLDRQTGSGLLVGTVKGAKDKSFIVAREALLAGDVLRIGYEDDAWHAIYRVSRSVPAKGRLFLKMPSPKNPSRGAPVFLTDRREKALADMLAGFEDKLKKIPGPQPAAATFHTRLPRASAKKIQSDELWVYRSLGGKTQRGQTGIWLSGKSPLKMPSGRVPGIWWWLPPVVWPEDEPQIKTVIDVVLQKGGRNFVLNAPWQTALFTSRQGLALWAGPFCNTANPLAVRSLVSLGFDGVIVSPELGQEDYLQLAQRSPLPLGIVISGNWPLCVSRVLPEGLQTNKAFISPRGEAAWRIDYGPDCWVYPNWELDLTSKRDLLEKAGYRLFVHLIEPVPKGLEVKKRPGLWNWDINLF